MSFQGPLTATLIPLFIWGSDNPSDKVILSPLALLVTGFHNPFLSSLCCLGRIYILWPWVVQYGSLYLCMAIKHLKYSNQIEMCCKRKTHNKFKRWQKIRSVKFSVIFIWCIDIFQFTFEIGLNNIFLELISFISFYFLKMWLLDNFKLDMCILSFYGHWSSSCVSQNCDIPLSCFSSFLDLYNSESLKFLSSFLVYYFFVPFTGFSSSYLKVPSMCFACLSLFILFLQMFHPF